MQCSTFSSGSSSGAYTFCWGEEGGGEGEGEGLGWLGVRGRRGGVKGDEGGWV